MTVMAKFLFDLDLGQIGPDGAVRRRQVDPDAEFTRADLERARAEAFAAGEAAGAEAARAEIATALAQAVERVATGLPPLLGQLPQIDKAASIGALSAAEQVVRKLLPALAERGATDEILAVVRMAVERLRNEPRIVIRLHDALLDPLQPHLTALRARLGFEGKLIAIADDRVKVGDVHVEWADGGVERDAQRIWRDIDEAINRAIADLSAPAAP
jgi:flagellar assembly protein FliH